MRVGVGFSPRSGTPLRLGKNRRVQAPGVPSGTRETGRVRENAAHSRLSRQDVGRDLESSEFPSFLDQNGVLTGLAAKPKLRGRPITSLSAWDGQSEKRGRASRECQARRRTSMPVPRRIPGSRFLALSLCRSFGIPKTAAQRFRPLLVPARFISALSDSSSFGETPVLRTNRE